MEDMKLSKVEIRAIKRMREVRRQFKQRKGIWYARWLAGMSAARARKGH